jgi:hypothetical protein
VHAGLKPRTTRLSVVLAVFWVPVFAGCLGTPSGPSETGAGAVAHAADWSEAALNYSQEHNHADPSHHQNLSTSNFRILGHDPLISDDYGTTPYGYLCGDAAATTDGRRLAVVESRSDVGFAVADVTDPTDPKWLGELVMRRTYVYDLAVVPDGEHVVLVTSETREPDPEDPLAAPGLYWRSPCADEGQVPVTTAGAVEDPVPRPLSLLLVSIADPAQPTIIDQRPLAGLGHSVSSAIVDGRTWVAASVYATNSGLSNYNFYEIVRSPAGTAHLNHLSTFTMPPTTDLDEFNQALGHNDAWIHEHPKTGTTIAWLAHWNQGLVMVDLSDPSNPVMLGRWSDHDPSAPAGDTGQTHSVHVIPQMWGDRHYTVIGPEHAAHPPSTPTGIMHVVDTTDPRDPFPVASWTFPHDVDWSGRLMYSLHYLTVVNHTAFVSAYHAGVWAVDLSPVAEDAAGGGWHNLEAVGVFMPVYETPAPPNRPFRWAPTLEEVHAFDDGTLVTFDSNTGLYAFRFDAADPAPSPAPWPLSPPLGVR